MQAWEPDRPTERKTQVRRWATHSWSARKSDIVVASNFLVVEWQVMFGEVLGGEVVLGGFPVNNELFLGFPVAEPIIATTACRSFWCAFV